MQYHNGYVYYSFEDLEPELDEQIRKSSIDFSGFKCLKECGKASFFQKGV